MNIYKIALTGGPCAGKTTVLPKIKEMLEKDGYHVITIPETAAYLINNGTPPLESIEHSIRFQKLVLKAQLLKEEIALTYCYDTLETKKDFFKDKKGIIILCDRGIMDNRAYLTQEDYDKMLINHNLNELELLYSYDLAINLISLATTNKELYVLDGVRYEDADMAALRDQITSSSWLLHPNLYMIKPTDNIEDKINLVHNIILMNLNNIEVTKKIDETKEEPDINLNQNNSKICTKTIYSLVDNQNKKHIVTKLQYKTHNLYTLDNIIINEEEFLILYDLGLLELLEESTIINYIKEGNRYRITKKSNQKEKTNTDIKKKIRKITRTI